MSIYATIHHFTIEEGPNGEPYDIFVQAIPGHIGHPSEYPDGDPFAHYYDGKMPPPPRHPDQFRGVVIVDQHSEKSGQEYTSPLLVLSREEYFSIGFEELMERIAEAISERDS